jgi:hypothetical protein
MGIAYNTSIVRNGLVLHLDAANVKSYPGSGTAWNDLSGNNNTATLTNGVGFNSTDKGSLTFDGVDDFVQVGYKSFWDSNVFGTATNFTLECWYKPNVFRNWDTIITKADPAIIGWYSAPEGASIWSNLTGFQAVFSSGVASNPTGSNVILSYTTSVLRNYHLCFTGDGTTLRFYVDGVQQSTALISGRTVPVTTSANGPTFGRRMFMNGELKSSKLYTRALSVAEIRQNFEALRGRYGI